MTADVLALAFASFLMAPTTTRRSIQPCANSSEGNPARSSSGHSRTSRPFGKWDLWESSKTARLSRNQIGTLRFLGTFLADPVNVPVGVIAYVASQLRIANPLCVVRYAERIQTQQDHAQEIRQHYGYKELSDRLGGFALMRFLYARAWVGTERPRVLFDLATAWLLDKKILLPGVTTLTRLIASIRERVAERLWQRLSAVVTPEQRTDLEGLLSVPL